MSSEGEVTISLVAHYQFCPRRAWLEAMGEKTDSAQVQIGTLDHAIVDDPKTARKDEVRSLDVWHRSWGVHGRLDAARWTDEGWVVREFKATPVRLRAEVTEPTRVQLALQSACLRDMGQPVAGAEVFFTTHHRTVPVDLNDQDFEIAREAVEQTRRAVGGDQAPEPLEDSPKCMRCSHAGVCLPDERKLTSGSRRILVADPDGQIVHLATPGSRAFTREGRLIVQQAGKTLARVPLEKVQGLQVHGNIDLSSGLIRELLWRDLKIVWCSGTGRLYGWSSSTLGPNGHVRVEQHVASAQGRLAFAREFISSKIANQATQLRRAGGPEDVVATMRSLQRTATNAALWQEVLGIEGEAAALYFERWPLLIKERLRPDWLWSGRSGRPATDGINAMLNYSYSMLTSDAIRALVSCGLDPHAGFLHSSRRNKPALALDLMEEFRAPVADSVVQLLINNGEVKPGDFDAAIGSVRMNDASRRSLIAAYERRMQTEFRHPIFGYAVTWRRALEIQARQILGCLDGSQHVYKGIRVR